ncbi:predicted protein [Arabidopsis lyrata subsp. lyrata]|uniref:Predicted protein n=1 Tax=Arabidopsis lyrata subsp. lyrata TaxID=81972 RepID=D7LE74_ARALL|nr:predicted protein [Arabidopsis lyrata subsp. lyrata]
MAEKKKKLRGGKSKNPVRLRTPMRLYGTTSERQTDTIMLGLSHQEATDSPYIASMGVNCFTTEALLSLLTRQYPSSNDFGSEVIPAAIGS